MLSKFSSLICQTRTKIAFDAQGGNEYSNEKNAHGPKPSARSSYVNLISFCAAAKKDQTSMQGLPLTGSPGGLAVLSRSILLVLP